jgi:hypothetical protein
MAQQVYGENDSQGRRVAVLADCNDPAELMMQREEYTDTENIDFSAIKKVPADALKILIRFLLPSAPAKNRWRHAQIRLALVAHMIDIDGIGGKSFEKLAQELGCSRALLSLRSLEMIDGLEIEKCRNGKARASRETYREAAIKSHIARGHRMSEDSAGDAS